MTVAGATYGGFRQRRTSRREHQKFLILYGLRFMPARLYKVIIGIQTSSGYDVHVER